MYHWFTLFALLICSAVLLLHVVRLVRLGNPPEYSERSGNIPSALRYSFTVAMHPLNKESAHLYMPTYLAGLVYHIGTFISIPLFFVFLTEISFPPWLNYFLIVILSLSVIAGSGILLKRIIKRELRLLSNLDDFVSNILVTAFQLITVMVLFYMQLLDMYYIITGLLLLYIPVGKLKHIIYFFAARYHLGYFYGWRGVWPLKKKSNA